MWYKIPARENPDTMSLNLLLYISPVVLDHPPAADGQLYLYS